ncbi:MAG: molybdopterin molybdotransferase MoeA [Trichloromonas sp.]|jgi:molybdopterin molybdotransferase|nr:molybdopterin molybdotransferase MoeA [Trichloromonas sp.]
MLDYDQALGILLETVQPLPPTEVPLADALGRVAAAPVQARWDLPPADNSAMDGYAFAFAGQKAGERLRVSGFLPAGAVSEAALGAGDAIRIMTGAPLPQGCDTVVPIEEAENAGDEIQLRKTPEPGAHVRLRGEEFRAGEMLLAPGTAIHSGEIGLLAAAGVLRISVHPAPRVALLSTGDELVELGETPGPGQIVNSNFHLLAARLREEGCAVIPLGLARDRAGELDEKIARGLAAADLLITTGGVSVGDRDLVQETLRRHDFRLGFWKVAIKPGKPVLFGTARDVPVLGLPGNPAASAATFELFARVALRRLGGRGDPLPPRLRAVLTAPVKEGGKRQAFLWGTLTEAAGRYAFSPSSRQDSGQTRSLQGSRALLPVPVGAPDLAPGEEVEVLLLRLPPGRATP